MFHMQAALDSLDEAIAQAEEAKVSAKYGKKCRRKVQAQLDMLMGNPPRRSLSPATDTQDPTAPPVQTLDPAKPSQPASSGAALSPSAPHIIPNGVPKPAPSANLPKTPPNAAGTVPQVPRALPAAPKAAIQQSPTGVRSGVPGAAALRGVTHTVAQPAAGPTKVSGQPPRPVGIPSRVGQVLDTAPVGPRPKTAPPAAAKLAQARRGPTLLPAKFVQMHAQQMFL
jgi:hypothetical protein